MMVQILYLFFKLKDFQRIWNFILFSHSHTSPIFTIHAKYPALRVLFTAVKKFMQDGHEDKEKLTPEKEAMCCKQKNKSVKQAVYWCWTKASTSIDIYLTTKSLTDLCYKTFVVICDSIPCWWSMKMMVQHLYLFFKFKDFQMNCHVILFSHSHTSPIFTIHARSLTLEYCLWLWKSLYSMFMRTKKNWLLKNKQ